MAVAIAYPDAEHGGLRTKVQGNPLNLTPSLRVLLSQARTVLREFGADSETTKALARVVVHHSAEGLAGRPAALLRVGRQIRSALSGRAR
jgi:hypothetical protein